MGFFFQYLYFCIAFNLMCQCVCYLGSGIHYINVVTARVGLHDSLQHHLVLLTASTEAWEWLTAPAHCCLCQTPAPFESFCWPLSVISVCAHAYHTDQCVLVEVGQSGKSSSAPEPWAAHDDGRCGRLWDKQLWRVCITHLGGYRDVMINWDVH